MTQATKYRTIHCDVEEVRTYSVVAYTENNGRMVIPLSTIEDADNLEAGPNQDVNIEDWKCEQEGWDE